MTIEDVPNIIILGGGASGTLLAIQLLRASDSPVRITLIEKRQETGRGFAYGEAQPMHLLNIRAANMSAYPDAPDHFIEWLERNGLTGSVAGEDRLRFVSRLTFGAYLASELEKLTNDPSNALRFTRVHGEAVALSRTPLGISVQLANHRRIIGDVAVLATGYNAPGLPSLPYGRAAWTPLNAATVNRIDSILLLGTGLSMIDHVQSLVAAGYQGTIHAISRRGLLPEVHRLIDAEPIDAAEIPFGASLAEIWRWFRARAKAVERSGSDWRAVVDGLRPHVQTLWQSLSSDARRRFVQHARPYWDVRRHRMAPEVAATIEGLIERRRLVVTAAKITSITPVDDAPGTAEVHYRHRGKNAIEALSAQAIIDCTGFNIDIQKSDNLVVRSLLEQGLARSDKLALGFDVAPSSALIGRDGRESSDLFAIGPLTRGAFWETTGIPDIRVQAANLVGTLLQVVEDRRGKSFAVCKRAR